MAKPDRPNVVIIIKPVDGGRAVIGLVECPFCGQQHFTTHIRTGELEVFCEQTFASPGQTIPKKLHVVQIL